MRRRLQIFTPTFQILPISIGTPSTGAGSTGAQTLTFSHTVAAGNRRVLVVGGGAVDGNVSNIPITGVTYGGVAMTLVDARTQTSGSQEVGASLWILLAPAVGTADVVITHTASCLGRVGIACAFYNVDQGSPQDTTATGQGTSVTPTSLSRTSATSGALGVDLVITRQQKTHAVGAAPQELLGSQVQSTGGEDCTLSMSTELSESPGSFEMSRSWTTDVNNTHSMMVLRKATS